MNYREAGSVVYFHNAVLYIFNGAELVFATLLLERVTMRAIILNTVPSSDQDAWGFRLQMPFCDTAETHFGQSEASKLCSTLSGHQVERPKRHFKIPNFGAKINRSTA